MNKKIITICSSASHYKQVLEIQENLKKMGFKVLVPKTATLMKKKNDFDVEQYKTWFKNKNDYGKKTELMKDHFKKVLQADAILVTNFDKKGIKGYIGGNVLMEMTLAFHFKKPIVVLNEISEDLSIKEEIYGVGSKFLNGDLQKIKYLLSS